MNLPEPYLDRMRSLLGDAFDPFLSSYDRPPSVGLRVNTLKLSPEALFGLNPVFNQPGQGLQQPASPEPIPWTPSGFILDSDARPGKHPYHAAGLFYLQDPSAMAAVALLDPQPGEMILDLAAAPGGKTTQIAARMQGKGLIVANDPHPKRVRDMAANIARWGARNIVITGESPQRLAEHFGSVFDRVLVDAPCSGEGMFRKDAVILKEWTLDAVQTYAYRQDQILMDAARLVRPGGRLVYATCTFSPEEDEGTIARFLAAHPDFEILTVPRFPGFSDGNPGWVNPAAPDELAHTVRLWPHQAPGEGHFVAVLKRAGESSLPGEENIWQEEKLPQDVQRYFSAFAESTLRWQPPHKRLTLRGSFLYFLPEDAIHLGDLNVIQWGWWLGTVKKNRFEPSHALAMSLQPEDVQWIFGLEAEDPRTKKYLQGEVLASPGENGWVLVTVDGFPLGWGKRVQGRVKSHAQKWFRWIV